MATKTFRPKKKGSPQSNVAGLGPPRVGKTALPPFENNWLALTTVKFTVLFAPCDEVFVADKVTGEDGQ